MDIDLKVPNKVKITHEALLLRHTIEFEVDRPVQAWQWMNQTRSVPDQNDWVRPEVTDAWRRCLEDYCLPLGNYDYCGKFSSLEQSSIVNVNPAVNIEELIKRLSRNFHLFLKEAGVMMVLTAIDGRLLYVAGEQQFPGSFMSRMHVKGANWCESVLGNNGIGSTAILKKPVAFQGMEHFLTALHPFTTVGYPLLDDAGELMAVIGLLSDHQESMNSLFTFLHFICVLVNTDLPLSRNLAAQERVLEKINFNTVKQPQCLSNNPVIFDELDLLIKKAVKLQHHKIPILITGESGVGKDHFVKLLKNAGPRKDAPLIAINCASIPHNLIESELFGYETGSFTGAKNGGKPGKFMLADKGVLFLDEIGDMSFDLQSTLLRVLETSEFTPVGGTKSVRVDVQVVAATNVQLLEAVEAGRFRRDLYYRLNGAQIHLLPLRERTDKQFIIRHILERELSAVSGVMEICPEVLGLIEQHHWPGNIRQLINVIRATLYTASGPVIGMHDLPVDFIAEIGKFRVGDAFDVSSVSITPLIGITSAMSLMDWELHGIKTALKDCEGNISLAARKLGITRTTLYKKIERFGLNKMGNDDLFFRAM